MLFVSVGSVGAAKAQSAVESTALGGGDLVYYWSGDPGVLSKPVAENAKETYAESDRMWQGLPTIAVTDGGRMWCAWQTGDSIEGSDGVNNYDVMYYSDDGGKTWNENFLIFDVSDDSVRLTDPRLFQDQFGKLWLVLIRGGLKGVFAIEIINPDCANPESELRFGTPKAWMKFPPAHRPTILKNGRWITPYEYNCAAQETLVCLPDDVKGVYNWVSITSTKAETAFPSQKKWGEAQIIELDDGRLMMLSRLPGTVGGGMEISYSDNYGADWSKFKADNGVPYITPNSKFHVQRLESGAILLVTHATTSARNELAAYLSYDDGKTYPYSLMLDDCEVGNKWGVSYPEAAQKQGENGEIYIVYDSGRYDQKEIRLSVVIEDDVKAGKIVGKNSFLRGKVSYLGNYTDYVKAEQPYERYVSVEKGTKKSELLKNFPQSVTLVTESGEKKTFGGEWECPLYDGNKAGRYTFSMNAAVPSGYQDRYSLLKIYVEVGKTDAQPDSSDGSSGGSASGSGSGQGDTQSCSCGGNIGSGGLMGIIVSAAGLTLLVGRKKNKSED